MTYNFLMMHPRKPIRSALDLAEEALVKQEPTAVVRALSAVLPQLMWKKDADGGWFGSLQGEDGWYEFRISANPDYAWSVCTSHRATMRSLVPKICTALDVVAFDGHANLLIYPQLRD